MIGVPVASSASTPKRPVLTLVKAAPFTVKGQHFKARERVQLFLSVSGATVVRSVRAGAAGSFTADFDEVAVSADRCSVGFSLRAIGAGGSRAALRPPEKTPQPLCPVP